MFVSARNLLSAQQYMMPRMGNVMFISQNAAAFFVQPPQITACRCSNELSQNTESPFKKIDKTD